MVTPFQLVLSQMRLWRLKGESCGDAAEQLDIFAGRSLRFPLLSKEPPVQSASHSLCSAFLRDCHIDQHF